MTEVDTLPSSWDDTHIDIVGTQSPPTSKLGSPHDEAAQRAEYPNSPNCQQKIPNCAFPKNAVESKHTTPTNESACVKDAEVAGQPDVPSPLKKQRTTTPTTPANFEVRPILQQPGFRARRPNRTDLLQPQHPQQPLSSRSVCFTPTTENPRHESFPISEQPEENFDVDSQNKGNERGASEERAAGQGQARRQLFVEAQTQTEQQRLTNLATDVRFCPYTSDKACIKLLLDTAERWLHAIHGYGSNALLRPLLQLPRYALDPRYQQTKTDRSSCVLPLKKVKAQLKKEYYGNGDDANAYEQVYVVLKMCEFDQEVAAAAALDCGEREEMLTQHKLHDASVENVVMWHNSFRHARSVLFTARVVELVTAAGTFNAEASHTDHLYESPLLDTPPELTELFRVLSSLRVMKQGENFLLLEALVDVKSKSVDNKTAANAAFDFAVCHLNRYGYRCAVDAFALPPKMYPQTAEMFCGLLLPTMKCSLPVPPRDAQHAVHTLRKTEMWNLQFGCDGASAVSSLYERISLTTLRDIMAKTTTAATLKTVLVDCFEEKTGVTNLKQAISKVVAKECEVREMVKKQNPHFADLFWQRLEQRKRQCETVQKSSENETVKNFFAHPENRRLLMAVEKSTWSAQGLDASCDKLFKDLQWLPLCTREGDETTRMFRPVNPDLLHRIHKTTTPVRDYRQLAGCTVHRTNVRDQQPLIAEPLKLTNFVNAQQNFMTVRHGPTSGCKVLLCAHAKHVGVVKSELCSDFVQAYNRCHKTGDTKLESFAACCDHFWGKKTFGPLSDNPSSNSTHSSSTQAANVGVIGKHATILVAKTAAMLRDCYWATGCGYLPQHVRLTANVVLGAPHSIRDLKVGMDLSIPAFETMVKHVKPFIFDFKTADLVTVDHTRLTMSVNKAVFYDMVVKALKDAVLYNPCNAGGFNSFKGHNVSKDGWVGLADLTSCFTRLLPVQDATRSTL